VGYLLDQMRLHGEEEELKKEVVRLALKFGIVTPYTSYLVLEEEPRLALDAGRRPGWAAATAPPGAGGRGGGGGAFGAEPARAREAREAMMGPGMGAGAVGAAVDLGAMKQAGAAPMAGARGGASAAAAQSVRALGGKVFYLDPETGFWVDSEYKGEGREVKMKYLGRAYLALVAQRPDIARFLAVGEKAKLQVGEVGLVVSPDFDDADEGQVNELLR
jgi:Ca-activated chloride channel family protein